MALHPKKMNWFEVYVPRHETVRSLGVLARTGKVELDTHPKTNVSLEIEELRDALKEFWQLESRYREYWPKGEYCPVELPWSALDTAKKTLEQLRRWGREVDANIDRIRYLMQEKSNLEHLRVLFEQLGMEHLDLSRLSAPMKLLYVALSECPIDENISMLPDGALMKNISASDRHFVIAAGLPEHANEISSTMNSHGCVPVSIPPWLTADREENLRRVTARIVTINNEHQGIQEKLEKLSKQSGLEEALGNIGVLKWYIEHAPEVETGTRFCHVTGWTTEPDESRLNEALRQADIHAMIRFPVTPVTNAPTIVENPWWVQPFEFFTQLIGTPGKSEVDPTGLLAIIIPLLFGYMFPDVGHGLLLILTGVVFARRWPPITFLIPCGVVAIGFGFVFGEFFSFHAVIPALWLKPLDDPMAVMVVPLVGGVLLMLLGLLLASIEARWRGELRTWLAMDAAIVLLYASALLALFYPVVWPGCAAGVLWYFIGGFYVSHAQPFSRLLELSGQLLGSAFQLFINTISFARVGAFALGHIALSSILMTLVERVENPVTYAILIVLGNLFIVTLEGLLVFVQTTRLILFEFFSRFLHAEGRIFKPLRRPTSA